jgi:DNA-binding MarR family transcriptional regulator
MRIMSPTTSPTFGAPVLGQTEKALNAILSRELAGTGLTEPLWVTLTVTVGGGGTVDRDELIAQLAGVFRVSKAEAESRIAELEAAQLLQSSDGERSPVEVTESGRQLHGEIRGAVTEITQRLWGDLPAEDLAIAGRVLDTILARADAELTGV